MSDSKGSGRRRSGSFDLPPIFVAVPDRGGEGENSLADADDDVGGGMSAVLFEVELAFKGVVDRSG